MNERDESREVAAGADDPAEPESSDDEGDSVAPVEDVQDMEWIRRHGACPGSPPSSQDVLQAVVDFVDDLVDDAADGDPPAPG